MGFRSTVDASSFMNLAITRLYDRRRKQGWTTATGELPIDEVNDGIPDTYVSLEKINGLRHPQAEVWHVRSPLCT